MNSTTQPNSETVTTQPSGVRLSDAELKLFNRISDQSSNRRIQSSEFARRFMVTPGWFL